MGLSFYNILVLLLLVVLLKLMLLINIVVAANLSLPSCHDDERSALLHFKKSFVITKSASPQEGAYPKVLQWKFDDEEGGQNSNCCSWDGVECDEKTGHVIGLNLTNSCLFGSINSNSTLFSLFHLRSLSLSGELPSQYVSNWNEMKVLDANDFTYMSAKWNFTLSKDYHYTSNDLYEITIISKGVERYYSAIQNIFAFIDLSSNKFEGGIPESFGNLKGLHSLNLSNNMLTGCIPSSLGNLAMLESLDLSQNNLSCEIPQQLQQLGFLAIFNVSHNNLIGGIPRARQFGTFDNSSFEGNSRLCGDPLSKKCENSQSSKPPSVTSEELDEDSESLFKLDWIFVLMGYISGLVIGVVLGDIVITRRNGWLVKMLSKKRMGKRRRRDRRN
ncbi:receptor-like protein 33 [Ziziphus jujuba]|uniref:Receptor-like protein 33 n=1 Tax=Ziziphus jujuba TaxID=326968 RepID=A0A6P4AIZ2_ZIZJJ|nr:receptor-like protein 33 [Ziziphus jujuba]